MELPAATIMAVACGYRHTAAVTEDGGLWAWGAGDEGQLGLTSLEHRPELSLVGGLEMFGEASASSCSLLGSCIRPL